VLVAGAVAGCGREGNTTTLPSAGTLRVTVSTTRGDLDRSGPRFGLGGLHGR
jgi:hypothetical protein